MHTNRFLNEIVDEKGLTVQEFADLVGISRSYAAKILSPGGKLLPSDKVSRKIVTALEMSKEQEKEFWRILKKDREELEAGEPGNDDVFNEIVQIKRQLEEHGIQCMQIEKKVDGFSRQIDKKFLRVWIAVIVLLVVMIVMSCF